VNAEIVTYDVYERHGEWSLAFDLSEQFDEVLLTLSLSADSDNLSTSCIEGGEQLKSTASAIFVLHMNGSAGSRRSCGELSSSRLKGGLLVDAKNPFVRLQVPSVEVADLFGPSAKLVVSQPLGI
jgi:hypothetical protein